MLDLKNLYKQFFTKMIGAILGDIVGSIYEWNNIKSTDFSLFSHDNFFTDDTVLTVATAEAILTGKSYTEVYKNYYHRYPNAGYGGRFHLWARSESNDPYKSWGNGSAMRISPVGYAFHELENVLIEATRSAEVTHNHPEGIKGAQATASCIFLARTGKNKKLIKLFIEKTFGYNLSQTLDEIRPTYQFNESCQETVPQAIIAFLESNDFESAIRNAVSLGGDSDTLTCITGGIAQAFYGIPQELVEKALSYLDQPLREITECFMDRFDRFYQTP